MIKLLSIAILVNFTALLSPSKDLELFLKTFLVNSQDDLENEHKNHIDENYEGSIVRTRSGNYRCKARSQDLLKYKDFEDAEFEIVSVEEGQGNWSGYAKTLFIKLPDGTIQQSGLAGNQAHLRQVLAEKDAYAGGEATVQYFTKTPDGKLRFPVAKVLFKSNRDI